MILAIILAILTGTAIALVCAWVAKLAFMGARALEDGEDT